MRDDHLGCLLNNMIIIFIVIVCVVTNIIQKRITEPLIIPFSCFVLSFVLHSKVLIIKDNISGYMFLTYDRIAVKLAYSHHQILQEIVGNRKLQKMGRRDRRERN